MTTPLLEVNDLTVDYPVKGFRKPPFRVLHSVSIEVAAGQTIGLVGESGSGKTTLGRAVLGLAPVTGGTIEFDGRNIVAPTRQERRRLAHDVQVIFQDPYTSLNPSMQIEDILAEPLEAQGRPRVEARKKIAELIDRVGLPQDTARRRPREFSGGQRQRIAIARALALDPRMIVCDEPTSALDLSTQATVLELLRELQQDLGIAYLFISHDLAVVRAMSSRIAVMHLGRIVEVGDSDEITERPTHPYTQKLLMAAPVPDPVRQKQRRELRHRLLATTDS